MQLSSALISANFGMSAPNVRSYELFSNIQSKDLTQGDDVLTPYFAQVSLKAVCCNDEVTQLPSESISYLEAAVTVVLPTLNPIKPVNFTFSRSFRFDELVSQINDNLTGKYHVKLSAQELAVFHVKNFATQIQAYILRLLINLGHNEIVNSKAVATWLATVSDDKDLLLSYEVEMGNDVVYVSHEVSQFVYSQLLSQLVGMLSIEYSQHQKVKILQTA